VADGAVDLMHRIHTDFRYEAASTRVDTPLAEVFVRRRGVCQDFAHLMIGAMRMLGLATRYVSGYLLTAPPAGEPALVGADASHAWVQVYVPDAEGVRGGWLELDPTNALRPDTQHVRLAVGRDYGDVTPLRGVIRGGGRHTLEVRVDTRQVEPARMLLE
jgi:transglutaminase-like putative cysteine protease